MISTGHGLGRKLAAELNISTMGLEGHDLKGPCPSCPSSDGFRLHSHSGIAQCYVCGATWSPFSLAEQILGDREAAKRLMVDVGIFEPRRKDRESTSLPAAGVDLVEFVARAKNIPINGFRAYGARVREGSTSTVELPMCGPDGKICSRFFLDVDANGAVGKGKNQRGKPSGLFTPIEANHPRVPRAGETWCISEGCKDSSTLFALGFLAIGLPTNMMHAKFVPLFQGTHVVLVPDRDAAGITGAEETARKLWGHAATIKIAHLPDGVANGR